MNRAAFYLPMPAGCGEDESPQRRALTAKVLELLLVDPALQEGPGVDAGRGVALVENGVATTLLVPPSEEVADATSNSVAQDVEGEMCPPRPALSRLARTTITMALQRTQLLIRRSKGRIVIAERPGPAVRPRSSADGAPNRFL